MNRNVFLNVCGILLNFSQLSHVPGSINLSFLATAIGIQIKLFKKLKYIYRDNFYGTIT